MTKVRKAVAKSSKRRARAVRPAPDWEKVRLEFETTPVSLRVLARKYGFKSQTTICRKRDAQAWTRAADVGQPVAATPSRPKRRYRFLTRKRAQPVPPSSVRTPQAGSPQRAHDGAQTGAIPDRSSYLGHGEIPGRPNGPQNAPFEADARPDLQEPTPSDERMEIALAVALRQRPKGPLNKPLLEAGERLLSMASLDLDLVIAYFSATDCDEQTRLTQLLRLRAGKRGGLCSVMGSMTKMFDTGISMQRRALGLTVNTANKGGKRQVPVPAYVDRMTRTWGRQGRA